MLSSIIAPAQVPDEVLSQRPRGLSKARLQELQDAIHRQRAASLRDHSLLPGEPPAGNIFASAPWWQRIVLDPDFRRAITNMSSRRLKSFEESYRPHGPAQAVVIAPHVWEPHQSQRLSHPAASAGAFAEEPAAGSAVVGSSSSSEVTGTSFRWTSPFPPLGYTLVSGEHSKRNKPVAEGPININIFTTCEAQRATTVRELLESNALAPGDELPLKPVVLGEVRALKGSDVMELITTDAKKAARVASASRQQSAGPSVQNRQASHTRKHGVGVPKATDEPVPMCYRYVGTVRPSLRLFRFRILCAALAEYADANRHRPEELTSCQALLYGLPLVRSLLYAEESHRPVIASLETVPPHLPLQDMHPGDFAKVERASTLLPTLVPSKLVEDVALSDKSHPPPCVNKASQLVYLYPPSPRFVGLENNLVGPPRFEFLRSSPLCVASLRRVYSTLKKDLTGRVPKTEWIRFTLDLMNLYFPSYLTQSNIELAEDEWLCRGTLEKPDFSIFFDCFFDLPLTLARWEGMGHMNELQYVQFWDFSLLAIAGVEAFEHLRNRAGSFMVMAAPPTATPQSPVRRAGSPTSAGRKPNALGFDAEQTKSVVLEPNSLHQEPSPDDPCRPTLPEFVMRHGLTVPLIVSSDDYRRHLLTQEILQDKKIVSQQPFRQPLLAFRKVEELLAQETREGRRAGKQQLQQNFDQSLDGSFTSSPSQMPLDDFPSPNMQAKLLDQKGKLQSMTEKQRQEAIKIQAMLAVENRSSAFALYESTFAVEEHERDEVDDILDFCSDISDQIFENPRESVRQKFNTKQQLLEEAKLADLKRATARLQKAGGKAATLGFLTRKTSRSQPQAPDAVESALQAKEDLHQPTDDEADEDRVALGAMRKKKSALHASKAIDEALREEVDAVWAAAVRQAERERVLNLRSVKGSLVPSSGGRVSPTSGGYATFQALDRHAAVQAQAQGGLARGAELTSASMHAAVVTRPFAGVSGALKRRVQRLDSAGQPDCSAPKPNEEFVRSPTSTSVRLSTRPATTDSDPYDLRRKALLEVEVDYSGTNQAPVPVSAVLQRMLAVDRLPPPLPSSREGRPDDAVSDGGAPSYRDLSVDALADAITVTGTSNGCKLQEDKTSMPSFLSRINRERIVPPRYVPLPPAGSEDPVVEPSQLSEQRHQRPPAGSRPSTRGPQLLPRAEWAKVVVAPIRPPRYQVPQLPQRPPSDEVVINGRVQPKPHRSMQIIHAIHMGAASNPSLTPRPLAPTVVKQHVPR
jgi:hypothetical protein